MSRTIYVSCSQVATACGRHKYQPKAEFVRQVIDTQLRAPADVVEEEEVVEPVEVAQQAIDQWMAAHQEAIVNNLAREKMTNAAAATVVEQKTNQEAVQLQHMVEQAVVASLAPTPLPPVIAAAAAAGEQLPQIPLPPPPPQSLPQVLVQEQAREAALLVEVSTAAPDVMVHVQEALAVQTAKVAKVQAAMVQIAAIPAQLHQTISKTTGVLAEEAIVDGVQRDLFAEKQQTIMHRNTKMKYKSLPVRAGWRVLVGGKPDGLVIDSLTGKVTIIEVKNRQRRLFHAVPEYERIQCQIYMWLFGSDKCVFREHYHGDTWSTELLADPVELRAIQAGLVAFGHEVIVAADASE
jgi:hypothetical protein